MKIRMMSILIALLAGCATTNEVVELQATILEQFGVPYLQLTLVNRNEYPIQYQLEWLVFDKDLNTLGSGYTFFDPILGNRQQTMDSFFLNGSSIKAADICMLQVTAPVSITITFQENC
ncbi:MAG: hypothetical protein H7A05_03395 [Pseudomonadales bacterium]|nr:hypothetical protein [Pseudomonadales bacterium]